MLNLSVLAQQLLQLFVTGLCGVTKMSHFSHENINAKIYIMCQSQLNFESKI